MSTYDFDSTTTGLTPLRYNLKKGIKYHTNTKREHERLN